MSDDIRWTVEELVELSARLLPEDKGSSKRVRWNPNPRLIRYYTTLGLLDRAFGVRGRAVHYGSRHLLQLLSVKALQAQGHALQEIQERLYGQPNQVLQELSGLPDDWFEQALQRQAESTTDSTRSRFWKQPPNFQASSTGAEDSNAALPLQGIELATGMTLLLDRRIYPQVDTVRLRQVALTLLEALESPTDSSRTPGPR
ncbi:MAG: MerR family transcriptional regulator [Vulcanimicrobiota bacterium]